MTDKSDARSHSIHWASRSVPYRNAHWIVLSLLPLTLLAFWPGYFGQMRDAPLALHGHGLSAIDWVLLLALQLWSIHARHTGLHRNAGLALFVIVPVFAGASLAAIQGGFALFAAHSDPFHSAFGARLGMVDLIALCTLVGLVRHALVARRSISTHASAMLATLVLVLPPILARLVPILPGFGDRVIAGQQGFTLAFYIGQALAIAAALGLQMRDRNSRSFLVAALSIIGQSLIFSTAGASSRWAMLAIQAVAIPPPLLALAGAFAAALALWLGWIAAPPRRRRTTSRHADSRAGLVTEP